MELIELSIGELRKMAKGKGIKVINTMKKTDLVKEIEKQNSDSFYPPELKTEEVFRYNCEEDGCNYFTQDKNQFTIHEHTHTPQGTSPAEVRSKARKGETFYVKNGTFFCDTCNWKSPNQSKHDSHWNDVHAIEVEKEDKQEEEVERVFTTDETIHRLNEIAQGKRKFNDGFINDALKSISYGQIVTMRESQEVKERIEKLEHIFQRFIDG